jgi:hypothetical protein
MKDEMEQFFKFIRLLDREVAKSLKEKSHEKNIAI